MVIHVKKIIHKKIYNYFLIKQIPFFFQKILQVITVTRLQMQKKRRKKSVHFGRLMTPLT